MFMKKACFIGLCVGFCSLAQATIISSPTTTVNAPSSLTGYEVLNGAYAYSWGIPVGLAAGQTISSATISFTSVTLNIANSSGVGYLYTDLLNLNSAGVTTYYDGDAAGDYFATAVTASKRTSLGTQVFPSVGTTASWNYVFNASQLAALNAYATNGLVDIGLDPDCHFSVGNISFAYTTSQVPDGASTALLLGVGLTGLGFVRRKLAAKS